MNTVTLPKNQYMQILSTQDKFQVDLSRLERMVSYMVQDEVSPVYMTRLSKIEKGLSAGKGVKFKNKSELKKFFRSL